MGEVKRDYEIVGHTDFGEEIRKKAFDDASIQKSITEVLDAAPDGKTSGIILAWDPQQKKIGGRLYGKLPLMNGKFVWTYGGTLDYQYETKDWTGGVQTGIWF